MDSTYHFLSSLVVGAAVSVVLGATLPIGVVFVGYAVVLGVGIDLDHFLLARYNTGGWRALRGVVSNPELALFDRDGIFAEDEVGRLRRLLSHVVIAGVLVGSLAYPYPDLAILSAAVLYVHVLLDLIHDVRQVGAPSA